MHGETVKIVINLFNHVSLAKPAKHLLVGWMANHEPEKMWQEDSMPLCEAQS